MKEVDNIGIKLWYIDKSLKNGVVDVRREGDRSILVKLGFRDMVLNVISAYVPQLDDSFDDTNTHFVRTTQESDIKETMKRMEGGLRR